MSHPEDKSAASPDEQDSKRTRKPYQPPQVRHERVFETMALSCGKVQVTQGSCRFNRKARRAEQDGICLGPDCSVL